MDTNLGLAADVLGDLPKNLKHFLISQRMMLKGKDPCLDLKSTWNLSFRGACLDPTVPKIGYLEAENSGLLVAAASPEY